MLPETSLGDQGEERLGRLLVVRGTGALTEGLATLKSSPLHRAPDLLDIKYHYSPLLNAISQVGQHAL